MPHQRAIFCAVAFVLLTIATLDIALLLRRVLDAYTWEERRGIQTGALHAVSGNWVDTARTVIYLAQTSIADAVLVRVQLRKQRLLSSDRYDLDIQVSYNIRAQLEDYHSLVSPVGGGNRYEISLDVNIRAK